MKHRFIRKFAAMYWPVGILLTLLALFVVIIGLDRGRHRPYILTQTTPTPIPTPSATPTQTSNNEYIPGVLQVTLMAGTDPATIFNQNGILSYTQIPGKADEYTVNVKNGDEEYWLDTLGASEKVLQIVSPSPTPSPK
jgi:hypothetical protein